MLEHDGDWRRTVILRHDADRDAEKSRERQRHRHADTAHGAPHHNVVAIELNHPYPLVGASIARREPDRQSEGVEPQCAARPGRSGPAVGHLTPRIDDSQPGSDAPVMPPLCHTPLSARLTTLVNHALQTPHWST